MELVAASKMRKAVGAVLMSRPYAKLAWEAVLAIGLKEDTTLHPLLRQSDHITNVLMLLVSSDRGLAGGYNTNVIKTALQEIKRCGKDVRVDSVCIGKRGADALRRIGGNILASFTEITNHTKFDEVLPIGSMVVEEFSKGSYDRVVVVYTDFVSAVSQRPVALELLPLGRPEDVEGLGEISGSVIPNQATSSVNASESGGSHTSDFTFEPSARDVLDRILPRLVETMVYQAVLEAAASEHSSRMMAMRNASDSASDMIDDLTFTFNQARQAGITQEIAEISSGKAALEK